MSRDSALAACPRIPLRGVPRRLLSVLVDAYVLISLASIVAAEVDPSALGAETEAGSTAGAPPFRLVALGPGETDCQIIETPGMQVK